MRLVASSNPDDVDREQALHLLIVRAVLTRTVCRELLDSGGEFNDRRPRVAYALLVQWIKSTLLEPDDIGASPWTGLDAMVVPAGCEDILQEIRDGAQVCDALESLMYADSISDAASDSEAIAKGLDAYWKAHGQIAIPSWREF